MQAKKPLQGKPHHEPWWQRPALGIHYPTRDLCDGLRLEKTWHHKRTTLIPIYCMTSISTHCNCRQIKEDWKLTVCPSTQEYKFHSHFHSPGLFGNVNLFLGHKCVLGVGFAVGYHHCPAQIWQTYTHSAVSTKARQYHQLITQWHEFVTMPYVIAP